MEALVTEIVETALVAADADRVWHEAGGFDAVADWHPLLDRVEVNGAVRRAYDKQGGYQVERLLACDPVQRELRYTIEQTRLPVENWNAVFRVEAVDHGRSRVLWMGRYEPKDANDSAARGIRTFLRTGLDALAERYANH
jgi:mxaD protein